MSERQAVVKHFADRKVKFNKPVDLAVALRQDQVTTKELSGQKEYVEKVLKSGYTSTLTRQLFEDVNSAKPTAKTVDVPEEKK